MPIFTVTMPDGMKGIPFEADECLRDGGLYVFTRGDTTILTLKEELVGKVQKGGKSHKARVRATPEETPFARLTGEAVNEAEA